MIILHDSPSGDLSHIQAMANIEEGFALFDYVRIDQSDNKSWIGQIVQPNQNISTIGNRLDPTILHGLQLMQTHTDIQSVDSVQVFDILILGEYIENQMLTPRLRPLPGAIVNRLDRDTTISVIGIPQQQNHSDGTSNVVGYLLNAENVPLCLDVNKFNYHIMISGGTGCGKSNVGANAVDQALKFGKCVLIHDAKPDYRLVNRANTDPNVESIWRQFEQYGLQPHLAENVVRVGFYGICNPSDVDVVVGFRASDFSPEILASLFFPNEQLQFEGFASAADYLSDQVDDPANTRQEYSLDDILNEVQGRMGNNVDPNLQINQATGSAILRKVRSRRRSMPWLDTVGRSTGRQVGSRLARGFQGQECTVQSFSLGNYVNQGQLLVIDYSQMDAQAYALILSYFLRICQEYRRGGGNIGIVQMVDEAHRIFDNESQHSDALAHAFERVMREGRSVDYSIILSLQNTSQIPHRVMNNLNGNFRYFYKA